MKKCLTQKILVLTLVLTWAWSPAFAQFPAAVSGSSQALHGIDTARIRPIGDLWARTDLFFGTAKPDGSVVTSEEFQQFLDKVITPRFPDGLTLLVGFGQFRSGNTIVQERSMLLILLYPPPTFDSSRKIEEIRASYKKAFQQESVLRVDSAGLVSF